jgi:5-methylcytosine-specific restriction enzyme A
LREVDISQGSDKEFSGRLRSYFQCDRGAYSPVTWTEAKDGQITLTGAEKKIVVDYFGADSLAPYKGNDDVLQAAGLDAKRPFRKFPTGELVFPKVKYPKPDKTELRLYFNKDEFKVSEGFFWGTFIRNGEIWICYFSPWLEKEIEASSDAISGRAIALEAEEDSYQDKINETLPSQKTTSTMAWNRNPQIAFTALKNSGFICEVRPDLETFISRSNGKPFLEAHHLIPMKIQNEFPNTNLDTVENICVLTPFVHRKLHHAPFEKILPDLIKLLDSRKQLLERLSIVQDDVLGMYRR